MIEREANVRIYSETLANLLGAKVANGKLVRVSSEGFYEVTLSTQGGNYTTLLPIASTVIMVARPDVETETLEVER